jgi:hypothetical protein
LTWSFREVCADACVRTAVEDGSVHHGGEEQYRAAEDVRHQEVNAVDSEWAVAVGPDGEPGALV